MSYAEPSRWKKLWGEVEPLVNHALAVLTLELSLLLIGYVTHLLEVLMPQQGEVLSFVEAIDAWTSLIILSLFAAYTVIMVSIRLSRSVLDEIRQSRRA